MSAPTDPQPGTAPPRRALPSFTPPALRPDMLDVRGWRIATKLRAVMLLLVLVPVLILTVTSTTNLSGTLTGQQRTTLLQQSGDLRRAIEQVQSRNLALVELSAKNVSIAKYTGAAIEDRFRYDELANAQLDNLRQQEPAIATAGILDRAGTWIADSHRADASAALGGDAAGSDYFAAALAGDSYASSLQVAPFARDAGLFYATPIRDETGQIVGVLAIRTDTSILQGLLDDASGSGGRRAFVLDADGVVVADGGGDDRLRYRSVVPVGDDVQQRFATGSRLIAVAGNQPIQPVDRASGFATALRPTALDGIVRYSVGGSDFTGGYSAVAQPAWRVVLGVDNATYQGPINAQVRNGALIGFALLAVALAVALLTARQLTTPLGALNTAAARIAQGDYNVRVPVVSDDEIGQVATTVNAMVDRITGDAAREAATSREMQSEITHLLNDVARMADGDLTVRAEVSTSVIGSVADAVNVVGEDLGAFVTDVSNLTNDVVRGASSIRRSSESVAASTGRQVNQILRASEDMNALAAVAQDVSRQANRGASVAADARRAANDGRSAVVETVAGMARIDTSVTEAQRTLERARASVARVDQSANIIRGFADQTELLAINAGIEAATARQEGAGFAVIASGIRTLAERASAAAADITATVEEIVEDVRAVGHQMDTVAREVDGNAGNATRAGELLATIGGLSDDLADLAVQIAERSAATANDYTRITNTMEEISAVSTANATGVQETARTATSLEGLTSDLRQNVGRFRTEATAMAAD